MKKILVLYGTTEGQAGQVADHVAGVLRDFGHDVTTKDVKDAGTTTVADYDAVVVGASVHMGKHDKHVVDLVQRNRDALGRMPTAFFSVSLAAIGDTAEAEGYVAQFEQDTGWKPGDVAVLGGALPYTHYGFLKRRMMKRIVGNKPGALSTDTSRDHVYTDWADVARFAERFAGALDSAPAS